MNTRRMARQRALLAWLTLLAICAMPLSLVAQTRISLHSNKYSPQDDVRLGRQAAQEAERQFPLLRDETVRRYVASVGERLVAAIPAEFQHPEFQYYFKVVNANDINAFALPGGPMYVNRGMIEAAKTEGEMAGVMAHEISHVALRHGTAQATHQQKYGILAGIAGAAGTILGGPGLGQLAQAPFSVYFLRFSREYETEADILGAQIMARAGYDPRDLANVFQTIERQGGGGGGFLSDHPSPSDRYERINREAALLRVQNPMTNTRELASIQERLSRYPRAQSMAQIERSGQRYPSDQRGNYPDQSGNYPDQNGNYPNRRRNYPDQGNYPEGSPTGRVDYPSTRYENYSIIDGDVQVSVPANWRQINDQRTVWFVPEGGYGSVNGQSVFTHGVSFGVVSTNDNNLQRSTDEVINSLTQGNSNLRLIGSYQRTTLSGRTALSTSLFNTNEATGQRELIRLVTTQVGNGQLLYMLTLAPQNERNFESAFQHVANSVRINGN